MRSFTFLVPVLTGALLVASSGACSGATSTDLFQGGDGPAPSGDDQADTGPHGGVDSGSGEPDATPGGGDETGGGGQGDGSVTDSAVVVDASPPPVDSSPPVDAAPPPPTGVYCGDGNGQDTYCKVGEACCVTSNNSKCMAQSAAFCSGTQIDCDDKADCPSGQICCGTYVANHYQSVRCQSSCNATGGFNYRFCDPTAAIDECAADGQTCNESQSLPGYYICN